MVRASIIAFLLFTANILSGQEKPPKPEKPDYRRKEEIIYFGKRYRIHNNYFTFGPGFLNSSIREQSQKCAGADFVFHIREEHFQLGLLMSGEEFLSNNNVQVHFGYGLRKEKQTSNLGIFAGPTYFTGVTAFTDPVTGVTRPDFYNGYGFYVSMQGISKFYYDFGIGLELFADVNYKQTMYGFKVILFFSGAYRGVKRNYNPNVRAENP
jgi:hypothetical protein